MKTVFHKLPRARPRRDIMPAAPGGARPLRTQRAAFFTCRSVSPMAALLLAASLAVGSPARADDLPTLVFHQHRFVPDRIEVPAHVKFQLKVKNTDDSSDEFESVDLNREKLVSPGQTITVFLGPLDPGEYKFFGDFHPDTAKGVLVAK